MKALSKEETTSYRKCKADIKKAAAATVAGFRVLGERIKTVHGGELWRAEYESFEEFCIEELPFGVKRAYQVMRAVSVSTNVENEGQARELLGLAPEEQDAVVAIAEAAGEVTAPAIRSAREQLEEATADKEGDEKTATISELVAQAEQEAAATKPPAGGGRGPRPPKDRKSEVDKLLDWALRFGRLARKSWQGLDDVAEANDLDWYEAVKLLEAIQERTGNSTDVAA